jgi:hypothetical protein
MGSSVWLEDSRLDRNSHGAVRCTFGSKCVLSYCEVKENGSAVSIPRSRSGFTGDGQQDTSYASSSPFSSDWCSDIAAERCVGEVALLPLPEVVLGLSDLAQTCPDGGGVGSAGGGGGSADGGGEREGSRGLKRSASSMPASAEDHDKKEEEEDEEEGGIRKRARGCMGEVEEEEEEEEEEIS